MPRKTPRPHHNPGQAPDAVEVLRLLDLAGSQLSTHPEEALHLAEQARSIAVILEDQNLISESDYRAGQAQWNLAAFAAALECIGRAASGFAAAGNVRRQAAALRIAGVVYNNLGKAQSSLEYLGQALQLARDCGDKTVEADALNGIGWTYQMTSHYSAAIDHLTQALGMFDRLRDYRGMVSALTNLGIVHTNLGDFPRALELLLQAYRIAKHELEDPNLLASCLVNVGNLHQSIDNHRASQKYLRESLEVSRGAGDRVNEVYSLVYLGLAELNLERADKALPLMQEALGIAEATGFQQGRFEALTALGRAHERLGDAEAGLRSHGLALEVARQLGDASGEAAALAGIGAAHLMAERYADAFAAFGATLELAEKNDLGKQLVESHLKVSEAHAQAGNYPAALAHYQRHHQLERQLHSERHKQRAQVLEAQFALETERAARARAEALVDERTRELEEAQVEIVNRLALAGEYRDDRTGTHTWRVGWIAGLIARELGWDEERVNLIRMAARLHDIGKIGTPDALLSKQGPLTDPEFQEMEHHTLIGSSILSGGHSALLRLAEEIALSHHERWDGHGYPRGLIGENIPLSGRIVAVADVFDALTHSRSYKRAWKPTEALRELQDQAGRQFDPRVIEVAARVLTPANLHAMETELNRGEVPTGGGDAPRLRPITHRASRTALADDTELRFGALETAWTRRAARERRG